MSWAALVDERGQKASEQMRGPVLNAPQKESLSAGFASPDISGQAPNLTRMLNFSPSKVRVHRSSFLCERSLPRICRERESEPTESK
jgi:hypothetical protein